MAAQKHESKYKKEDDWGELKNCETSDFKAGKASSRPATFCKPVSCLNTLSVAGATTILPPAITVGGVTYVPTILRYVSGVVGGKAVYGSIQVLAAKA